MVQGKYNEIDRKKPETQLKNVHTYFVKFFTIPSQNFLSIAYYSKLLAQSRRVDDADESRFSLCKIWRKLHFSSIKIDDLRVFHVGKNSKEEPGEVKKLAKINNLEKNVDHKACKFQ